MEKILSILFLVSSTVVWAADNPYEQFDASKTRTNQTTVVWERVDDVQAACNAENQKYGYPPYRQALIACSMHTDNTCKIITGKTTTMWSLGHEMRHCFQGSWHN
jgi:hypothetical protein